MFQCLVIFTVFISKINNLISLREKKKWNRFSSTRFCDREKSTQRKRLKVTKRNTLI